jgi:hypothetical protein
VGASRPRSRRFGEWGGVLEHPANSVAWRTFDLRKPKRGEWLRSPCGGWVTDVAQSAYGHRAVKRTWLYYFGASEPPSMEWGEGTPTATVSFLPNTKVQRPRLSKREAKATPVLFAEALLEIARAA